MKYTSLVDMLLNESKGNKSITLISSEDSEECISYKDLYKHALKVLGCYQTKNLKPDDKVIIYLNDNLSFLYSFWGCLLGGITAVPITVGNDQMIKTKLENVIHTLGDVRIITSRLMIKDLNDIQSIPSEKVIVYEDIDFNAKDGLLADIKQHHTAFIQFSSGSTSEPKGVTLTHENLLTNLNAICLGCEIKNNEKTISWMPLTHDMGVIGFHLAPIYAGTDQILMPAMLFISNPLLYLEKAVQHEAGILCSPNFGIKHIMRFLSLQKNYPLDLSHVRLLFNGAEPISYDLCVKFIEFMEQYHLKKNVIFPVYGMAEASLAVSFPVPGNEIEVVRVDRNFMKSGERVIVVDDQHSNAIQFVKVGKPVDECNIRICNEEGMELGEHIVGEIYIKGRNVTSGYYNNKAATKAFSSTNGWKKTGDLGFLSDGQLIITGRKKDIIFINGQNFYSHDIESLLDDLNIPDINANAVCAIPSQDKEDVVVIFAATKIKAEQFNNIATEIKRYISLKLGKEIGAVIPLTNIPKTTSGKTQRYKLVENYLNGLYDEYISSTGTVQAEPVESVLNEIEYGIKTLFEEALEIVDMPIQSNFFEMGGNSIKAIYLISKINSQYNKNMEIRDVMEDFTIRGVSNFIDLNETGEQQQIECIEESEYYPVLPAQKRLFILNRISHSETMFNITKGFEINGVVSPSKIKMVLEKLTELHEALRTNFVLMNDEILQKVHKQIAIHFRVEDIEEKDVHAFIRSFNTPFDLEKDVLFKTALLRSGEKSIIVFCIHHIITDGTSLGLLLEDFMELYNGRTVQQPKYALKEYSSWKQQFNTTEAFRNQQKYWLDKYRTDVPVLNLPYDYPRPKALNYSGSTFKTFINMELFGKIKKLASESHTTEYAVLFSVFNATIHRYTHQDDFVIGTPVASRGIKNADHIVGMLVNTLPIRINIDNNCKFIDYLNEFSKNIFKDLANPNYYNEELIEQLNLKPEMNRNALFDVVFNMQNMQVPAVSLDGVEMVALENTSATTKVDLTLEITPLNKGYEMNIEFSTELFKEDTLRDFIGKYIHLLNTFTNNPEIRIKEAEILNDTEISEFLYQFNQTETFVENITFKDAFERQVEHTPDRIAIKFGEQTISYSELNQRANWIAKYINTNRQDENNIVAVLMERSIERAIVLIGCLKSGNAYLPIEPGYPSERMNYMVNDSKSSILMTDNILSYNVDFSGHILNISNKESLERIEENCSTGIDPDDAAYIIYTSGTTGNPKGVIVRHSNVWGYICAFQHEFNLRECDIVLQQASYSFDTFTEEMLPILTVGGCVSICTKEEVTDISLLTRKVVDEKITVISASPLLINELNKVAMKCSVHTYISGGDILRWEYISNLVNSSNVYNTYGPTETTVCATYHKCSKKDKDKQIPIGRPIANYKIYVLDEADKLCPAGAVGEICIGGIGVSKGYLRNTALTNEKFIFNPYAEEETIYKTGDLGRWTSNGELEYMGRKDKQVNIRGYRIETQEIERQLLKYELVEDAAVVDLENAEGEKYLTAYIIPNGEIKIDTLKKYLSQYLPEYMIPAYFVPLQSLPVTSNGKLDKKALPSPQQNMLISEEYEEARNDVEQELVRIWEDVLGIQKIGINHNFFELGGHSLKLTVMASRIHKELGVELKINELFSLQTIREISEHIGHIGKTAFSEIRPIEKSEWYEVSSAQKRMYMLQRFDVQSNGYNISGALSITGGMDIKRVEYVIEKLVCRHESLRTYFIENNGHIVQKICDEVDFKINYINDSTYNAHEIIDTIIQRFDLNQAPLFRVTIIRESEVKHVIVFDMHHIISDGVSIGVLVNEFSRLYAGENLDPLYLQYKDFADWQNKVLTSEKIKDQEEYWVSLLSGELPVLNMPTDFIRPAVQSFEGKTIREKIDARLYNKLSTIAKETGSTMYMLLLSSINIWLAKYTGQSDIIIGSPIAGRYNTDLQNVVGMFVNTLAMRNFPERNKTFRQFLEEVKQNCLNAYQNQDYQFEELIDKLNLRRDMSRNPLFDVMFTMQNMDNQQVDIQGLTFERFDHEYNISKFDISITAEEFQGELLIELEYCTRLFIDKTASSMITHLINILEDIAENTDVRLEDIEMLSEDEEAYILEELNQTYKEYPSTLTFQQLFEEQVLKNPGKQSVIYGEQHLTYSELHHRSNSLARVLRGKGIGRNSIAGIMVEKSLDMIVGILAIIKAGGAYLPIDLNYPEERIKYMLADSEAQIILTQKRLIEKAGHTCSFIDIDDPINYAEDSSNLNNINVPTDLIYVIYTSGTTGKPKGVMIEHRNLVNMTFAWMNHYKLDVIEAKLLQMASLSFDVFAGDLCRSLLTGGSLYICPDEIKLELKSLYALISENNINIFESTPGLIIPFMDYIYENQLNIDKLKIVIMGSDTCPIEEFKKIVDRFGRNMRILNSYGVTEATIDSSYYEAELHQIPQLINTPIGKPLDNSQFYILNSSLKPQPVGVSGELYIGGKGVARGYFKNEKLTSEKFIANPFRPGERMYKTGDLARWLPDGNVEFFGREDYQVKIRGYRIEIREIENQLLQYEGIKEAVVIDKQDEKGMSYLCAFVTAPGLIDARMLKEYLSTKLPDYMVPSFFEQLQGTLPITPNGKIDRRKLSEYELNIQGLNEYVAPVTFTEQKLAPIWMDVLGVKAAGAYDNFFELGGHSLKAIALASRIHKEFNVEVPLKDIFKAPTIRGISKYIDASVENKYDAIKKATQKKWYEASSPQKRMYMLQQLDPDNLGYNMSAAIRIRGDLKWDRFEQSLRDLFLRHEALRTCFAIEDGNIVQKIGESVDYRCECSEMTEVDINAELQRFVSPFDLGKAPLMRVKLIKLQEYYVLLFDIHHIISDGLSIDILINDLGKIYSSQPLEPLDVHYKDYSEWQNEMLHSEMLLPQAKYWGEVFDGDLPILNLPLDFARPKIQSYEGAVMDAILEAELTSKVKKLAASYGSTVYTVLLSAINILLSKYSGQEEIIVGGITAGRNKLEMDRIVGVFINTLALRNVINPNEKYGVFLEKVRDKAIAAYEHQDYPFEELLNQLNVKRDPARSPLFDVMFSMEDDLSFNTLEIENIAFEPIATERKAVNFDLRFIAVNRDDELAIKIEYCTKLFKASTIQRMLSHLINVIGQITQNSELNISDIHLLTNDEKNAILYEFNNTDVTYPREKTFIELFEEQVSKTPDALAVITNDSYLSYNELNIKANKLAKVLRAEGVSRNRIVAVIIDRSESMLVSIFAIIKAGGAYLPIDPDYPDSRINYILENSQAALVLTRKKFFSKVKAALPKLDVDKQYSESGGENLQIINSPQDLIYVIYTSGSTGNPKGVMIEHRSLINRLDWMQQAYPLSTADTILQKTTYTFDVSVWELLWWSVVGATVYLLGHNQEKDASAIVDIISKRQITTVHFVPSMLRIFLDFVEDHNRSNDLKSLKRVFASGEALQTKQVSEFEERLFNRFGTQLINLYGPTEATIDVSYYNCFEQKLGRTVPIGKPINNIKLYIVDKNNALMPVGIPGELCIAGDGVARGYLNNQELTDQKFVANPYIPHSKLYKTGDLARWLEDGNIEYLGRIDHQVKLRGFRIELEEIENVLHKYPGIKETVVVMKTDSDQYEYLCAYFTADQNITGKQLRQYLIERLPEYMVPSYFEQLLCMPLTSNGKLDRKQLPDPVRGASVSSVYKEPSNTVELKIAGIWKDLLQLNEVGVEDNFFELGGHSLKVTQMISQISKKLSVDVPFRQIFDSPTIKELAVYILQKASASAEAIPVASTQMYYQVSSAQKRMYLLHQFDNTSVVYNMPEIILIEGAIHREKLQHAIDDLCARHESLRTRFNMINGEIVQFIDEGVSPIVEYEQVKDGNLDEIIEYFVQPFNLSRSPLFRVKVIEIQVNHFALVFDMHHIISDGVSKAILVEDFIQLYSGQKLAPLALQYKDYAEWINSSLQEIELSPKRAYWLERFSNEIPLLNIKTDFSRPLVQSFKGNTKTFKLNASEVIRIKKLANDQESTLYMVFLSVINIMLSRYSGQEDILVGTPVTGRTHPDLQNIVGMFVNTLVMRNYPLKEHSYREFLQEVKEVVLEAYENQEYQFEILLDELNIKRDISRNPLFDVMFTMLDDEKVEMSFDGLTLKAYQETGKTCKFDLNFSVAVLEEEISISIQYCTDLFKEETIEQMGEHLRNIIAAIVDDYTLKIKDINILNEREEHKILFDFNASEYGWSNSLTVQELFEEQARKQGDALAVVFEDEAITYKELNERANQVAWSLRKLGVKPNSVVALMMEKSIEMIIGMIGVIKSGAAYLPLDVKYPVERIQYQLLDSDVQLLITDKSAVRLDDFTGKVLNISDLSNLSHSDETDHLDNVNCPEDAVYVIYTSGSTGKSKGVLIEHRNLVSLNHSLNKLIYDQYPEPLNIALLAPYIFDASVKQIFASLLNGHCLCLIRDEYKTDSRMLIDFYNQHKVDVSDGTPIILSLLCDDNLPNESQLGVKYFIIGGDVLLPETVHEFRRGIGANVNIVNIYGPTECCVDATAFTIDEDTLKIGSNIPIGKPLANTKIYILDHNMKPVPVGVEGEIYISGYGVGRGYINNEMLTQQKFISNPFSTGERMYRTGDSGKWLYDGNIEYIGRIDNQVKIRGYRIEPSEVEEALLKHENIKQVAVIDKKETDSVKYLCAYFVSSEFEELSNLRGFLSKILPDYMIPAQFIQLDQLPVTANGKLDKSKLLEMKMKSVNTNQYEEPRSRLEKELQKVWSETLHVENIGINDNFFELGGNSIAALKIVAALRGIHQLNIGDVFRAQTIKELGAILDLRTTNKIFISTEAEAVKLLFDKFGIVSGYEHFLNEGMEIIILFVNKMSDEANDFIKDKFEYSISPNYICMAEEKAIIDNTAGKTLVNYDDVCELLELENLQNCLEDPLDLWNKAELSFTSFEKSLFVQPVEKSYPILPIQRYTLEYNSKILVEIALEETPDYDILRSVTNDVLKTFGLLRSKVAAGEQGAYWEEYRYPDHQAGIYDVPVIDISSYDQQSQNCLINTVRTKLNDSEFGGLLYRALILKKDRRQAVVMWSLHHSIFDGESSRILKQTFMQYLHNYKRSGVNEILPIKDYDIFISDITQNSLSVSAQDLISVLELEKFKVLQRGTHNAITDKVKDEASRLLCVSLAVPEEHKDYFNENVWEISFELFCAFCSTYLNVDKVPALIYSNGRKLGDNYHSSIGEYIDLTPIVVDVQSQISHWSILKDKIDYLTNNKINFSNLVLDSGSDNFVKDYFINPINGRLNDQLMFNFLGYKSLQEQETLRHSYSDHLNHLASRDKDSEVLNGITFNTMYSESNIVVMVNSLSKKDEELMEATITAKLLDYLERQNVMNLE
ncbi:tyrocidine synthetase-3 [Paenibacillus forsythiae]|uniref:Tyrocidine synthetase-3 n=1 Tax=Paenibacillus forsythiae TaxID=365616 RepID=A0ABU3H2F6_9BACL|nr:non-ribosomal peptide synthetase [Paenibacillus forsythiae]MDT3424992.1 tyrocidine synthetase-3 [Paenibacillus forsythiae]